MLGIVLAALLGATPQPGTVHTSDGGRIRGTVVDVGPGGATVQLADGSTRKLEAGQVSRVDFADGTSWRPGGAPPAPAAAPAPALAATPAPATRPVTVTLQIEKLDTVFLARGGRVRCVVTEEGPDGVVARLVDGTERRFAPGQVTRIDWADGSRTEGAAPTPAPPAAALAAPAPAPPAPAPAPAAAAPAAPVPVSAPPSAPAPAPAPVAPAPAPVGPAPPAPAVAPPAAPAPVGQAAPAAAPGLAAAPHAPSPPNGLLPRK